jgi:hypothetical protein
MRCPRCGERVGGEGRPRGSRRRLAWIPAALLALWIVLRLLPYTDRARFYSGVSSSFEAFLHPAWAAVLIVVAVTLLALGGRRGRGVRVPSIAPDVHIRDEPSGKLTIVVSGSREAMARDFVVRRQPAEEERVVAALGEIAGRTTRAGTDRATVAETQREVYALGLALGRAVLGDRPGASDVIDDLPGEHLLLRIRPELARLPWELIVPRPGAEYLWQRYHLSRQVRDESGAAGGPYAGSGPLRVLVLANLEAGTPGRELPSAEEEARELMDLAAREPSRLRVVRKTPRSEAELRGAVAEGYDVVHFAGHATASDAGPVWHLARGAAVDPAEALTAVGAPPSLVFANACRSGPGPATSSWGGDAAGRLMKAGVAAFIGTSWELDDPGSAAFSTAFFHAVAAGATLGEAATAARSALFGRTAFTWANYVVYGDPARVLSREPGFRAKRTGPRDDR